MTMTRVERIAEQANRIALRNENAVLLDTKRYLREVERRLKIQISQLYRNELENLQAGRTYREGRARAILAQVQTSLAELDAERIPLFSSNVMLAEYEQAFETGLELMRVFEQGDFFKPTVPLQAVEQQVLNSTARLKRHSSAAIDKINQAVVNGLVRGRGSRVVTREIQQATGLLDFRAESIARTEMSSARGDARTLFYEEQDVPLVQFYATEDDRTCKFCGARHGHIYKRSSIKTPLHVRCRCVLMPVRRNWIKLDLIKKDEWLESREQVLAELDARGIKPNYGIAPFEKSNGLERPKAIWTPSQGFTEAAQ